MPALRLLELCEKWRLRILFGFFTKESRISIRKRHLFCFLRGSSTLYCRVYNTERWVLPMNLYALSVNHRVNPLGINSAEQPYFG